MNEIPDDTHVKAQEKQEGKDKLDGRFDDDVVPKSI